MNTKRLPNILDIVGKKVIAVKGYPYQDKRKKDVEPEFVFFDDGETYMQLASQDAYTYHDCDPTARTIYTRKNKDSYESFFTSLVDANTGIEGWM